MDIFGLQSHVKRPMADTVWERINIMAGKNLENRLFVTEFDVEDIDVDARTEDFDDFLRTVYSHPNTDAVILWTWLREQARSWETDPPFNRALFESTMTFGDEVVAKPEVCDAYDVVCNYPLNPNKAGVRYLNMIKRDWNTTSGHDNVDFLDMNRLTQHVPLFKGEYQVSVFNEQNELIETDFMTVDSDETCKNLDFIEFDTLDILSSPEVLVGGGSYSVVSDGYVGKGFKVSDRTHQWMSLRIDLSPYGMFNVFPVSLKVFPVLLKLFPVLFT